MPNQDDALSADVGSSYIHFNFTPDGDKTTASLFGDVPRGVMLDQPPIFLGGLLRWILTRRRAAAEAGARTERGVLLGSGFVGGEGLLGVALAGAAFALGRKPEGLRHDWAGETGAWLMGAVAFALLVAWFAGPIRAPRRGR